MNKLPVKIIHYRDYTIPVVFDQESHQYEAEVDGKILSFGYFNSDFEDDVRFIIDRKLDLICTFDLYPGARLEWFFNGVDETRDIRLIDQNKRILKIYLVENQDHVTTLKLNAIKNECLKILETVKKHSGSVYNI